MGTRRPSVLQTRQTRRIPVRQHVISPRTDYADSDSCRYVRPDSVTGSPTRVGRSRVTTSDIYMPRPHRSALGAPQRRTPAGWRKLCRTLQNHRRRRNTDTTVLQFARLVASDGSGGDGSSYLDCSSSSPIRDDQFGSTANHEVSFKCRISSQADRRGMGIRNPIPQKGEEDHASSEGPPP